MNVTGHPVMAADELRQQLYAGNLVVLTRLQALRDFVEYTRGELTELFRPHNPEYVHEHIDPAEMAKLLGSGSPSSYTLRSRGNSYARSFRRRGSRFPVRIMTCRSRVHLFRSGT